MVRIFLALAALVGLMWFFGWYGKADPAARNRALKTLLLYGIGGAILLLVVTGRIPWLFALFSAAVPILQRLLVAKQAWGMFKSLGGGAPASGRRSSVSTPWLEMELDHDTGEMEGRVIQGRYAGRQLSELGLEALLDLLQECRSDPQSMQLVEAYLDRVTPDWRAAEDDRDAGPGSGERQEVSVTEAWEILGLEPGASREEIIAAHRRLIQKLHPDRGGSGYLAARINQAKDILLQELGP